MTTLTWHDLQFALRRCPKVLLKVMKQDFWAGRVFVGGGFLRSIVTGDPVNDVDVFVPSLAAAEALAVTLVAEYLGRDGHVLSKVDRGDGSGYVSGAELLTENDHVVIQKRIHRTPNALTLLCFNPTIQIIHRWQFDSAQAVSDSFDFTCCCAAFWHDALSSTWQSICDERFYPDVAAKRLVYRSPKRNEDAGGSMLRVLKYYQKGYRISLDSLAAVIARLAQGVDFEQLDKNRPEIDLARVLTGLLREVDPAIDPSHVAHLPSESIHDLPTEA